MPDNDPVEAGQPLSSDVRSPAVSGRVLSEFLASEELARGFRPVGNPTPLRPAQRSVERYAILSLPEDQLTVDTPALAAGIVIARIDAEADFARLGLSAGRNYLWVDAKGPAASPWRGIMISADGENRRLLPDFRYTPDTEHTNAAGPLEHAKQYCNGLPGCLFLRADGTTGNWEKCDLGCCEVH